MLFIQSVKVLYNFDAFGNMQDGCEVSDIYLFVLKIDRDKKT